MSNAINLWSGEKGGTGKSWLARLDCQRHLDQGQDFFLIDTDWSLDYTRANALSTLAKQNAKLP